VKGHAFRKEAGVKLPAHVALNTLRAKLKTEVARKLQQTAPQPTGQDDKKHLAQRCRVKFVRLDHIKGHANLHAGYRHQAGITQ